MNTRPGLRTNVLSTLLSLFCVLFLATLPGSAAASTAGLPEAVDLTKTVYGYLGIIIFILAYCLIPLENAIHLRKSKPVLLAAGLIWVLLALGYLAAGDTHTAHQALKDSLLEYAELFLFLLVAMTYINAMEERNVFQALRAVLVSRGFTLRTIFWVTGLLAFLISPVADNLTTALLMGAVVMAVGGADKKFIALACMNVVIGANAGGAFSPFGDITTLMVWQKGKLQFFEFFHVLLPALVSWLVPALLMSRAVPQAQPNRVEEKVVVKYGAAAIILLFFTTIATAVCFHNFLHLPAVAGMMFGLGLLGPLSYHIKLHEGRTERYDYILGARGAESIYPIKTLIKSSLDLASIIEKISLPAFAISTDHKITHWNSACETFTGIPAVEVIGTRDHWRPFYRTERPLLADLVLNYLPGKAIDQYYPGQCKRSEYIDGAYEASQFFASLGQKGRWLSFTAAPIKNETDQVVGAVEILEDFTEKRAAAQCFDLMKKIARAEWDTLLFFYGVILCVGGLAQFGYLAVLSHFFYQGLGTTSANILIGVLSAFIDNIPVMFAVLTMDPAMSDGQWLLVTLTAGIGGSLLSIGSAAGVALMGAARGAYTFGAHLRWTPAILLGFAAGIACHLLVNAHFM